MTLSLVGRFGCEFALVVVEAAQDQEAEEPGTGALEFLCIALDLVYLIRRQADAEWPRSDALRNTSDF
ncbi:hypothetical protein CSQ93_24685 [Janthinobacterium sp. BJB426]|nr:hypothetical protein CSQ93_24685 [Janthinobacterium sp. BJB426]